MEDQLCRGELILYSGKAPLNNSNEKTDASFYGRNPEGLPYLEGEGEELCRPYCLSHSSLSFSRLSRSLNKVWG